MTMMTLDEAMAEVKLKARDSSVEALTAVIYAVASGDMIPKADAEQAVALVVQKAADIAKLQEAQANKRSQEDDDETQSDWDGGVLFGTEIGARMIAKDILALAPADALAEVQALKAERDGLKAAIDNIEELNMTEPDANGHRWAVSDLIAQEIVFSRVAR